MAKTTATSDDATVLLDLPGVRVQSVQRLADGARVVRLVTADEGATACPDCGVLSTQVKGLASSRPRDLPFGDNGLHLVWFKRRWVCAETACPRSSFTESVPGGAGPGPAHDPPQGEAGRRVMNGTCATVSAGARQLGLSWPVVMQALWQQAQGLLNQDPEPVQVLGIDDLHHSRRPT